MQKLAQQILLRAKDKLLSGYVYIYSIYLSKNGFDESFRYFLCSYEGHCRLSVFTLDEIEKIEILGCLSYTDLDDQ